MLSKRLECATPATQNDMTTCLETFEKDMFSSFPHRHSDARGKPATRDKMQKNQHFVRDFLQFWHFRHVIKQVGMSQSATPATQNDMTTSLETFEKDRFSSFFHRHGDATGKRDTQTRHVDAEKLGFCARLPAIFTVADKIKRQVGAPKRAFRARHLPIFTPCSFKIDVFLRVFLRSWKFATSKSMFRARLPSIFSTCQKMPRLPRHLHLVATWRSPANAICRKHATGHV